METAVGRTFYKRTREDLSHNGPAATAEGTQEKGRSNNAPLNYGHLNYSRLSRAINATTNKFEKRCAQNYIATIKATIMESISRNLRYVGEK